MQLFAIFDLKLKAFMQPFFSSNKGDAIRGFAELVNNPQHPVGQHKADYILYHLGEWDELTGVFALTEKPISVGTGVDFYRGKPDGQQ